MTLELCSDQAQSVGEPLAGSSAHAQQWLFVEECGSWTKDALQSPGLTDIRAELQSQQARVQLIRRPRKNNSAPRFALLAERDAFHRYTLDGELGEKEPLSFFVCTHGKRDRCCALKGNPVYDELAELSPNTVWQTSHLGGHRFAPTLVSMPSGYCFGWLQQGETRKLYEELEAGRLFDLDRVRGNVFLPPKLQAAELALRKHLDLRGLDDVELVADTEPSRWRAAGGEHLIATRATQISTLRCKSCGDEPKPIEAWDAQYVDS